MSLELWNNGAARVLVTGEGAVYFEVADGEGGWRVPCEEQTDAMDAARAFATALAGLMLATPGKGGDVPLERAARAELAAAHLALAAHGDTPHPGGLAGNVTQLASERDDSREKLQALVQELGLPAGAETWDDRRLLSAVGARLREDDGSMRRALLRLQAMEAGARDERADWKRRLEKMLRQRPRNRSWRDVLRTLLAEASRPPSPTGGWTPAAESLMHRFAEVRDVADMALESLPEAALGPEVEALRKVQKLLNLDETPLPEVAGAPRESGFFAFAATEEWTTFEPAEVQKKWEALSSNEKWNWSSVESNCGAWALVHSGHWGAVYRQSMREGMYLSKHATHHVVKGLEVGGYVDANALRWALNAMEGADCWSTIWPPTSAQERGKAMETVRKVAEQAALAGRRHIHVLSGDRKRHPRFPEYTFAWMGFLVDQLLEKYAREEEKAEQTSCQSDLAVEPGAPSTSELWGRIRQEARGARKVLTALKEALDAAKKDPLGCIQSPPRKKR